MEIGESTLSGADVLLHHFFERQAELRPGKTAVVWGGEEMTYGELERRANQVARYLRGNGIGNGSAVGLLLPRSAELYVALLGILKAGAAYVPLDPEYPPERLQFILADCGARALVTTSALAAKAGKFAGKLVQLETQAGEIAAEPETKLSARETGATGRDACYIIYTSGSTGRPKGVLIEHRSACNLVEAEGEIFQVQPGDRVYQGFSIAFDASVEEIWLAFFARAVLVAATREMVQDPAGLGRRLTVAGVTVLSCVPTLLAMLEDDIPTLRLLILGGEECPQGLVNRWCRRGRISFIRCGPTFYIGGLMDGSLQPKTFSRHCSL